MAAIGGWQVLGSAVVSQVVLAFGLVDLTVALALLAGFTAALVLLLSPRLTTVRRATRVWYLVTALVGIGLFVGLNAAYFALAAADSPITPTPAQVTGTWTAAGGARLLIRPNGTFAATDLPPGIGNMEVGQAPPSGHGTWTIGFDGTDSAAKSVIFKFACLPPSSGCVIFSLAAETDGPAGRPALFYYLGDPDDDDQYTFARG